MFPTFTTCQTLLSLVIENLLATINVTLPRTLHLLIEHIVGDQLPESRQTDCFLMFHLIDIKNFALQELYFAHLNYTLLLLTRLFFATFRYNYATLRIAALSYASLDLATIGYNFALLYYSTLSFGMLSLTMLRLDVTLLGCTILNYLLLCFARLCLDRTLLRFA